MAISETQIEQAKEAVNEVQTAASRLNEILVKVGRVILSDEKGKPIVSLTTTQKSQLLVEYNKAKNALATALNKLP